MRLVRAFACAAIASALLPPAHGHAVQTRAVLSSIESVGGGEIFVSIDLDVITMRVQGWYLDLSGGTVAAQIHGVTEEPLVGLADIALPIPGLPGGLHFGTIDRTIDLTSASSYNPAYIAASGGTISDALNALIFGLQDGSFYFNLTTTAFPEGEISGFLIFYYCPGDTNNDGRVENADLQRLLTSWATTVGDAAYVHEADFDENGTIENTDLQILLENWAVSCW